jgi:hypothetical protein
VGGFSRTISVSVNVSDGTCWVADYDNHQVVKLSADGSAELARVDGFYYPSISGQIVDHTSGAVRDVDSTLNIWRDTNGNGVLDATGNANASNWPNTTAEGAGFRGGDWVNFATLLRSSDRGNAAFTRSARNYNYGGRGVRLAP